MANNYVSSSDIWDEMPESAYGTSDSTGYDNAVAAWISVASRMVDRELGVDDGFFYPSSTDIQTKYYDGSGEKEQNIGHWAAVAGVAVSEEGEVVSTGYTALSTDDYVIWPYNRLPTTKLIMDTLNGSGDIPVFYSYRKAVKVTGIPGYSLTPPHPIQQAAKIQVARWLSRAKKVYQDQGAGGDVGGVNIQIGGDGKRGLDADIVTLLNSYKLELMP